VGLIGVSNIEEVGLIGNYHIEGGLIANLDSIEDRVHNSGSQLHRQCLPFTHNGISHGQTGGILVHLYVYVLVFVLCVYVLVCVC
jgi:hypothetical protein